MLQLCPAGPYWFGKTNGPTDLAYASTVVCDALVLLFEIHLLRDVQSHVVKLVLLHHQLYATNVVKKAILRGVAQNFLWFVLIYNNFLDQ